jgi:hypothetical protein
MPASPGAASTNIRACLSHDYYEISEAVSTKLQLLRLVEGGLDEYPGLLL